MPNSKLRNDCKVRSTDCNEECVCVWMCVERVCERVRRDGEGGGEKKQKVPKKSIKKGIKNIKRQKDGEI